MRFGGLVLGLGMAVAGGGAAAQTPLSVDTGLWEWSTTISGMASLIPPDKLAKMPPAARAQIAAMAGQARQPRVAQACLTAEKLHKGFTVLDRPERGTCTHEMITSRADLLEFRAVCKVPKGDMVSHVTLRAVGRRSVTGEIEVIRPGETAPQKLATITGRRIGSDCAGGAR